ncbi:MAG: putative ABC exporter domain-containing protein [Armatimonadota bacterium]
MRPLALLALWQLKNALRAALTDPRRLIPLLLITFGILSQIGGMFLVTLVRPPRNAAAEAWVAQNMDAISAGLFFILVFAAIGVLEDGLSGGFLAFSLADIDYLFPAPIPPKLVLAYRLAAKTGAAFFQAAFSLFVLIWLTTSGLGSYGAGFAAIFLSIAALFLCFAGYINVALLMKLVLGFGRRNTIRRWVFVGLVVMAALLILHYREHGWGGLAALGRSPVWLVLFFPCRLATDVLLAPLQGQLAAGSAAWLALFYLVSLGLVFSRSEPFYEASLEGSQTAARMLQAAREGNWSSFFALGTRRGPRGGSSRRPYAFPRFGRGAGALLWAHLAAAAKRPWVNFILPLAGGIVLALIAHRLTPQYAGLVVGAGSAYLTLVTAAGGVIGFRQGLARYELVRPLPFHARQVVLAEVVPRTLISSLFGWGAGLGILLVRASDAAQAAPFLFLCLPMLLLWLSLVQLLCALWYPDPGDRLQQALSGLIGITLTGACVLFLVPWAAFPLVFGAPVWLAIGIFTVPAAAGAALLVHLVAGVYTRFQLR